MATISQILPEFWTGAVWTITADDYTTLNWIGPPSKPTEAAIRANSAATDTILAARDKNRRQQAALNDSVDYLLTAFETIIKALVETKRVVDNIRTTATTASHTGTYTTWDATIVSKVTTMQTKITNLRNIT